jgi:hypothetical protein
MSQPATWGEIYLCIPREPRVSSALMRCHLMRDALASDAEEVMRTTLDIDEDVLLAAKEIARERKTTAGKVMSELVRKALTRSPGVDEVDGFPVFPVQPGAGIVTLEIVNRLRDEMP